MSKDFTVTINHPQRRLELLEVFGTARLHIKSIYPELATLPGCDEPQLVYYLDLIYLRPDQRRRLFRQLAARFNLTEAQVKRELKKQQVPIPAAECTLTIQNPHKWLL